METATYSVFEYLYRDAGNYKQFGRLLLTGSPSVAAIAALRAALQSGELFIAEQVGIPTLCEQLWKACETEFDPELDHVWHEFVALRRATPDEVDAGAVHGTLVGLVAEFQRVGRWDEVQVH